MVKQIDVHGLKKVMDEKNDVVLIDCREQDEHAYCSINGSKLIPLSEFENRALDELNKEDQIYIHCHHGGRSQRACEFLKQNGFENVHNVSGGIDAWALEIDKKVPRY